MYLLVGQNTDIYIEKFLRQYHSQIYIYSRMFSASQCCHYSRYSLTAFLQIFCQTLLLEHVRYNIIVVCLRVYSMVGVDIIHFSFLDGNVPTDTYKSVYISQFIRSERACITSIFSCTISFLTQSYRSHKLCMDFKPFCTTSKEQRNFTVNLRTPKTIQTDLIKLLFFKQLSEQYCLIKQLEGNSLHAPLCQHCSTSCTPALDICQTKKKNIH